MFNYIKLKCNYTFLAARLMNCFAASPHIAGTVNTHRMSLFSGDKLNVKKQNVITLILFYTGLILLPSGDLLSIQTNGFTHKLFSHPLSNKQIYCN